MKLWVVPWPYDYHGMGALVVMASTQDAALKKARKWFTTEKPSSYRGQPEWDKITEHDGAVYENEGCDC